MVFVCVNVCVCVGGGGRRAEHHSPFLTASMRAVSCPNCWPPSTGAPALNNLSTAETWPLKQTAWDQIGYLSTEKKYEECRGGKGEGGGGGGGEEEFGHHLRSTARSISGDPSPHPRSLHHKNRKTRQPSLYRPRGAHRSAANCSAVPPPSASGASTTPSGPHTESTTNPASRRRSRISA